MPTRESAIAILQNPHLVLCVAITECGTLVGTKCPPYFVTHFLFHPNAVSNMSINAKPAIKPIVAGV